MKVITLTLNPAFDVHCKTENFRLGHESFFDILSSDAGGKGVNISRALNAVGVNNTAIVVVGNENGDEYCKKLKETDVNYVPVFVEGRIRENIILHDNSEVETRVSFNGFQTDATLFGEVIEKIGEINADTVVTLTGSTPKGVNIGEVKSFVKDLKKKGAKVVIDCRSFSLADIVECAPFLIKPNKDELSGYIGKEICSVDEIKEITARLVDDGVENVIVSMGGEGAVLSCKNGTFYSKCKKIDAVSTIGAGDSMVAGFITACSQGKSPLDCLKTAVAFGTAACLQEGTLPPTEKDIKSVLSEL